MIRGGSSEHKFPLLSVDLMKKHASADHPPASVIAGAVYQIGFWQKQLQELVR